MSEENKNYDIWGNENSGNHTVNNEACYQASEEASAAEPVIDSEADTPTDNTPTGEAADYVEEAAKNDETAGDTHQQESELSPERQTPYGMGGSSGSDANPPKPVKPKKSHKAVIAGIACVAVLLALVGTGVYLAVDYVNDRFAAYEAALEKNEETTAVMNELTKVEGTIGNTDTSTGAVFLDVSGVVDKVIPSVVSLTVNLEYASNNIFFGSGTQSSSASGSGVIIGESEEELLIVTNNHVVSEDEQTYYYTVNTTALVVTFCDGSTAEAYVKGTDAEKDLAVIAIPMEDLSQETRDAIQVATIGDSDAAKVGNGVIAIGNALGYGQSCTVGYISALNRDITFSDGTTRTLMQVDAAINPGNSGGGLFDVYGNLIGINESKNVSENTEGIGYAIPISSVEDIITELMNTVPRKVYNDNEKGYLGIKGSDVPSAYVSAGYPSGAIVLQIFEDGGAAQSDLQLQDIITKINDVEITSMASLMEELSYYQSGETITLQVERILGNKFQTVEVEVTLGSKSTIPEEESTSNQSTNRQSNQSNGGSGNNGLDGLLP